MSIGLFDADYRKYSPIVFNLELMKISSYYKRKGEIVTLVPHFHPQFYSKFFYRQDIDDAVYPVKFLDFENIEYGGRAFSSLYIPMDLEIERCIPDKEIYRQFEETFNYKYKNKAIYNQLYGSHLRLSLDEKTVWDDWYSQVNPNANRGIIFFHDKNVAAIDGAREVIQSYLLERPKTLLSQTIGFKYPLYINDEKQFMRWCQFSISRFYSKIIFQGILKDETLYEMVSNKDFYPGLHHVSYAPFVNAQYEPDDFLEKVFPKILRQITFLRRNHYEVLLIDSTNFFQTEEQKLLLELVNFHSHHTAQLTHKQYDGIKDYDTLIRHIKLTDDEELWRKMVKVMHRYPKLLKEEGTIAKIKYEGGKFING